MSAAIDTPRAVATGRAGRKPPHGGERPSALATSLLLLGAIYCLIPVIWVVMAASKNGAELFSTFTFAPSWHLFSNIADLSAYRNGLFWHWVLNTALYAGVGAGLSTMVSAMAGYAMAKYRFPGRTALFNILLAGVLVPGVILAVPQYLLFAKLELTNTYWSVLLPSIISPYGIYLARIYVSAAVPDEVIEAARTDGARDWRVFRSIVVPMMLPGLVTIFLFQFVAIWNNYMLPYVMLGDDRLFPVTVGLSSLLHQGAQAPALYALVITGALLSILPLLALFLLLQRFWQVDLAAGAVKS
jgi:multiple sugar transport system permease protein